MVFTNEQFPQGGAFSGDLMDQKSKSLLFPEPGGRGYKWLVHKIGMRRGIPTFPILIQNKDCGYSLELPRRGGSNMHPQSIF